MKKLTNLFAWITLAVILTVGTVGANAGIMIADAPQCTDTKGGLLKDIAGIIVLAPQFAGIIVLAPQPCVDANGIIVL